MHLCVRLSGGEGLSPLSQHETGDDAGLCDIKSAYDATTGTPVWRFDTVPAPDHREHVVSAGQVPRSTAPRARSAARWVSVTPVRPVMSRRS